MTAPTYSRKNVHAFDQALAIKIGLKPAIVYNHVKYWIDVNVKNERSWKNGRVWMYQTQEDMADFFGYLSKKEVRESLELLHKEGYLDREKLSDNHFDQVWWYALPVEKSQEPRNSNSIYEDHFSSPSEGNKKAPSEGHFSSPSLLEIRKDKEKKQQQAASPSAAAFSCLKEFNLEESAIKILMQFSEERVKKAVAFVKGKGDKVDNVAGLLIWHCREDVPPTPEISKEEIFDYNKSWALNEESEYNRNPQGFRFVACHNYCEIIVGGQKGAFHFEYIQADMIDKIKEIRQKERNERK